MGRDADRQLAAIAAKQDSLFTRDTAISCGLTRKQCDQRLATEQWVEVYRGVYHPAGTEIGWRARLRAACMVADPGVSSHRSALAIWDLPGQRRTKVELLTPHSVRVRRGDVVAHQTRALDPSDVTVVDGIPVTTPVRTLIDSAAVLHRSTLQLAVDEALRRALVEFDELWLRFDELSKPGRRGIRELRSVLAARHPDAELTESTRELMLLRVIERAGLPDPVAQQVITDGTGSFVARVDAAYPDLRIALEYDSYLHHGGRSKYVRDLARRNELTALGWQVVHFTTADLTRGGRRLCGTLRAVLGNTGVD